MTFKEAWQKRLDTIAQGDKSIKQGEKLWTAYRLKNYAVTDRQIETADTLINNGRKLWKQADRTFIKDCERIAENAE
jgi:hypothetical protein